MLPAEWIFLSTMDTFAVGTMTTMAMGYDDLE